MTEVLRDKRTFEIKGEDVIVTRTVTEKFDAEEYLVAIAKMQDQVTAVDGDKARLTMALNEFKTKEQEAIKIRGVVKARQKEQVAAERAKAIKAKSEGEIKERGNG